MPDCALPLTLDGLARLRTANPDETSTIDVSSDSAGNFSVCAYSGYWEGQAEVRKLSSRLLIAQNQAEWDFAPLRESKAADILIAFDETDRLALVKAGDFAHPLACRKMMFALPTIKALQQTLDPDTNLAGAMSTSASSTAKLLR